MKTGERYLSVSLGHLSPESQADSKFRVAGLLRQRHVEVNADPAVPHPADETGCWLTAEQLEPDTLANMRHRPKIHHGS